MPSLIRTMILLLIPIAFLIGYVLMSAIGTVDVSTFALAAMEDPKPDNTALWTALIASLVGNVLTFITGIVTLIFQFKLKIAQIGTNQKITSTEEKIDMTVVKIDETQKKVEENTAITVATRKAVNGERDRIVTLEKEKSRSEGFAEGVESQSNDKG